MLKCLLRKQKSWTYDLSHDDNGMTKFHMLKFYHLNKQTNKTKQKIPPVKNYDNDFFLNLRISLSYIKNGACSKYNKLWEYIQIYNSHLISSLTHLQPIWGLFWRYLFWRGLCLRFGRLFVGFLQNTKLQNRQAKGQRYVHI